MDYTKQGAVIHKKHHDEILELKNATNYKNLP